MAKSFDTSISDIILSVVNNIIFIAICVMLFTFGVDPITNLDSLKNAISMPLTTNASQKKP